MPDAPYAPIPVPRPGPLPAGRSLALTGWLIEIGAPVRAGERVAELTIPGLLVDAVSPASGTLVRRNVPVGGRVPPGGVLGWVERDDG